MSYKKLKPKEILKPYVESIWIQEDSKFDPNWKPTKIIPSTKTDLIFYYGDPFVMHSENSKETIPLNVLHGQLTKPTQVSATGKTGLIIFSFYPWGISKFVDVPFNELTDKSLDLKLIFGSKQIDELHSIIIESKTNNERVNFIQEFLINRMRQKEVDKVSVYLSKIINDNCGKIKLGEISKNLNISRRHLQRRFSNTTGLSPKQFAEVIRFQKAIYLKRSGFCWGDIAEHCGYYDQSHFIKEINNFAGTTPEKIYSDVKPTKLMKYFNSSKSMSHFYNTVYL